MYYIKSQSVRPHWSVSERCSLVVGQLPVVIAWIETMRFKQTGWKKWNSSILTVTQLFADDQQSLVVKYSLSLSHIHTPPLPSCRGLLKASHKLKWQALVSMFPPSPLLFYNAPFFLPTMETHRHASVLLLEDLHVGPAQMFPPDTLQIQILLLGWISGGEDVNQSLDKCCEQLNELSVYLHMFVWLLNETPYFDVIYACLLFQATFLKSCNQTCTK